MVYSQFVTHKHSRISYYFIGIAIASFSIGLFTFLSSSFIKKNITLSGLNRVWITNVNSESVDIVWVNESKKNSLLVWGNDPKSLSKKSIPEIYNGNTYLARIQGVTGSHSVYFQIQSEEGEQFDFAGKKIWKVNMPNQVINNQPQTPAYGKVLFPSGKPYVNNLIVYEIEGFYPLATTTKQTGEWLIPLTSLVDKNTGEYRNPGDNQLVNISFPGSFLTKLVTSLKETRPLSKVIIIGTTQTIAQEKDSDGSILGVNSQNNNQIEKKQPSIVYPKENALIPGNKPLIRGTAQIGEILQILIQGNKKQYSYRTTVDEHGDWMVQYPISLEAGAYVISVVMKDQSGFPLTLRRTFTITKSGEQVLGEATGSPTVTLSPTPIPLPTQQVTLSPTIGFISATPIPFIQPTSIPTTIIATPQPPQTGGGVFSFLFTAILCLGAGIMLIFVF